MIRSAKWLLLGTMIQQSTLEIINQVITENSAELEQVIEKLSQINSEP